MTIRRIALLVFMVCMSLNTLGIFLDFCLLVCHTRPITHYAREHWWIGWTIVGVQVLAGESIALHFWWDDGRGI